MTLPQYERKDCELIRNKKKFHTKLFPCDKALLETYGRCYPGSTCVPHCKKAPSFFLFIVAMCGTLRGLCHRDAPWAEEGDTLQGCAHNPGLPSGAPVKRGDHIPEAHLGKGQPGSRGSATRDAHPKSAGMMQNVGAGKLGATMLAGGPRGECT